MSEDSASHFSLEEAVATWRQFHVHRRAFLDEDLNELESHLRDHIAHLMQEGFVPDEAFQTAIRALGDLDGGAEEYRKVYWGKLRRRRQRMDELKWNASMFKNYLTLALRTFKRHPGYTFINVMGLAVGIACFVLIGLYVRDELTFDRFHTRADQIYKAQIRVTFPSYFITMDPPAALTGTLLESIPDVEQAVRIYTASRTAVRTPEAPFYAENVLFTEPAFFELFSFSLQRGDPASSLTRPGTVLITPDAARTYFGDDDPIGQTLNLSVPHPNNPGREEAVDFEITGILNPPPTNSTLQFELVASLVTLDAQVDPATNPSYETYLLLRDSASVPDLQAMVDTLMADHPQAAIGTMETRLEALTGLHMNGMTAQRETRFSGNRRYIYLFSIVALMILLIGCVNFTNLSTARAVRRSREVGLRKVVGAQRRQLIQQFMGEAFLLTFLAVLLAVGLMELSLPSFNTLIGKQLDVTYFDAGSVIPWLGILLVLVGSLAGIYPAFVLSRFNPSTILKGVIRSGRGGVHLRRGLVVFQFSISIILIVAVLVVRSQLNYLQSKNLGLNPDQVIALEPKAELADNFTAFKQEVMKQPGVTHVTFASLPGGIGMQVYPEGSEEHHLLSTQLVDPDFVQALGIQILEGTDLADLPVAEASRSVLINETTASEFGWTDPLGKTVTLFAETPYRVVGVVSDFHGYSLKRKISPTLITLGERPQMQSVLIRLQAENIAQTLEDLRGVWTQFAPLHPFEYNFLDEQFAAYYRAEERLGRLFGVFSLLAVFIACLGLFGLAAYAAETRIKEIGIRKVLGASVPSLLTLLSKDFLLLVGIGYLIAVPVAYIAMQRWLEDFAYRIEISGWIFLVAGLSALLIALLTVSYQSIRAALANPVRSLRYE